MMYTPTLSLPSTASESHYQLIKHNVEQIMPEINNVLMEIGRIDVFKIYHGTNLLIVGIIDSPRDQQNIVSSLIVSMINAFNCIKDELPQSTEEDIAFIREFIGSFETNTLTVVIDI